MGKAKIDQLPIAEVISVIEQSNSYAECCRKIGYSDKGRHGPDAIKRFCE